MENWEHVFLLQFQPQFQQFEILIDREFKIEALKLICCKEIVYKTYKDPISSSVEPVYLEVFYATLEHEDKLQTLYEW